MNPPPIRVLTLIDSLSAGGAERVAVDLAAALQGRGVDTHVVVTRGDGPLRSILERAHVSFTILDRQSRFDIRPWRLVADLAHDRDVIHAHKYGSAVWGALIARRTGLPLVVHDHNWSEQHARGARSLIERRWIRPVTSTVVCVASHVADRARAQGFSEDRIRMIPNGVHIGAALPRDEARAELGLSSSGTERASIGIVARLRPEKAHDMLIEAMAMIDEQQRPELVIVGDGPCRGELDAQVERLGLQDSVVFAGEHRDAGRLMQAFDLTVVCSDWEGMPLAALESMAAGVPLVATRVGELPMLLRSDGGRLVEPRDPAGLAATLTDLLSDEQARRAMSAVVSERVRTTYSLESQAAQIQALYRQYATRAVSRSGAGRSAA